MGYGYRRSRRRGSGWGCLLAIILMVVTLPAAAWRLGLLDTLTEKAGLSLPLLGSPLVEPRPVETAGITPTAVPQSPEAVAKEYLADWEQRQYSAMYALLSDTAKASTTQQTFVDRHSMIAEAATVITLTATIGAGAPQTSSTTTKVPFDLTLETIRLGEYKESNVLPIVQVNGKWAVQWTPSVIFKELDGNNLIRMFPLDPQRGSILDRQGRPLATQGYILQVGVVPGEIKDEAALLKKLSDYLQIPQDKIKKSYEKAQPDWFAPVKDLPLAQEDDVRANLEQIDGVMLRHKAIRTYPNGSLASNVVGYVSKVTADDLQRLASKGYGEDDVVGRSGIEQWGDEYLAGQRGGKLAVVTPKGEVVKIIAERQPARGLDIQLTLDIDIQREAEKDLGERIGSVVILDPRDNSVLAMVTSPRFDPNKFVTGFTDAEWQSLITNQSHPLLNRAAESAYPTGSIFKVMTMSAGMDKGGYQADTPMNCPGSWVIPGTSVAFANWVPQGQGVLPLTEALTESCNPAFYQIGYELNIKDPFLLPNWARQFGMGQKTGIIGIDEVAGIVPDPSWKQETVGEPWYPGDAVNLAIGQGFFLATPLQMANLYSSLAAGGDLRTPVLVRKIVTIDGQVVREFVAQEEHRLPPSPATLATIKDGMSRVTSTPLGTASYAFLGFKTPMAAKTGSAQNEGPLPHAWFAGYAPLDEPRVTILLMVENAGSAAGVAAPRARAILDYLFPDKNATPTATTTATTG